MLWVLIECLIKFDFLKLHNEGEKFAFASVEQDFQLMIHIFASYVKSTYKLLKIHFLFLKCMYLIMHDLKQASGYLEDAFAFM